MLLCYCYCATFNKVCWRLHVKNFLSWISSYAEIDLIDITTESYVRCIIPRLSKCVVDDALCVYIQCSWWRINGKSIFNICFFVTVIIPLLIWFVDYFMSKIFSAGFQVMQKFIWSILLQNFMSDTLYHAYQKMESCLSIITCKIMGL